MSAFIIFVAKLGLEPRQTEPESVVLPLHHLAIYPRFIVKPGAKVLLFCETTKYIDKKNIMSYMTCSYRYPIAPLTEITCPET